MISQKAFFTLGSSLEKNPSSRDILRQYLWSQKIEGRQISNLIISIDSPFKCDHFYKKTLPQ